MGRSIVLIRAALRALAFAAALAFATTPASAQFADQKTWAGTSTGSANDYVISIDNWTVNLPNVRLGFIANFKNTGATRVNVSGVGLTAVKKQNSAGLVPLVGGEIVSGGTPIVFFDGTEFVLLNPVSVASPPTRQVFATLASLVDSQISGTYNTPAGATSIYVRFIAGGGAGGAACSGGSSPGHNGVASSFNSIVANPGTGGDYGTGTGSGTGVPGVGGNSGTGTASLRIPGADGNWGQVNPAGAASFFGGGGAAILSTAGLQSPVYGAGGAAGSTVNGNAAAGGSGGAGEYVELRINNPASNYGYGVGGGGAIVSCGAGSARNGGPGRGGILIVDEFYD